MSYHPHGTPSFRNLVVRPMWITLKTALRTVPFPVSYTHLTLPTIYSV